MTGAQRLESWRAWKLVVFSSGGMKASLHGTSSRETVDVLAT